MGANIRCAGPTLDGIKFLTVKTGVKKDGTIVAQQLKTINNSGAYRGSGGEERF